MLGGDLGMLLAERLQVSVVIGTGLVRVRSRVGGGVRLRAGLLTHLRTALAAFAIE